MHVPNNLNIKIFYIVYQNYFLFLNVPDMFFVKNR